MKLNKLIKSLTPNYAIIGDHRVFTLLLLAATLLRFPFFFRDYIDRDESTFILMGQSWVDGFLPYTELWDLKPPITFLFFAGIIYVFGKSFLAIRFIGALLVAATAFFTFKIGTAIDTKKVGFWAAMAAVALQSLFGSIQGVMSEHLCMTFFMPGLWLLLESKRYDGHLLAGILIGLAVMTKLNIAYTALFLGLYLFYYFFSKKEFLKGAKTALLYGVGILIIVAATFLPYYGSSRGEIWWNSVVLAALEYAGARRSSILNLAPTFIVLGIFFVFAWKKKYLDFRDMKVQLILVAVLGALFSFAKAGRINSHYLIQLHPILIVLVAICITKITFFKRWKYTRGFIIFFIVILPAESYLEYYRIVKHKIEHGTFYNGEGIAVPQYLQKNHPDEKNVLFLGYHIGYWGIDSKPPTMSATHPSNICRNELFPYYQNPRKTGIEELTYIMTAIKPAIVVTRTNRLKFDKKLEAENEYIDRYLENYYELETQVEQADIYKRLE